MQKMTVLLASTKASSGKSAIAIGAFLKIREEGREPGYFKAIGDSSTLNLKTRTDKDVSVISAVVSRKFAKEEICPQFFHPEYYLDEVSLGQAPEVLDKIKDAYESIKEKTDYIIIEGNHDYTQYRAIGLDDFSIAKEFGAQVILVAPIRDDNDFNEVIAANEYAKLRGLKVAGVILNGLNKPAEIRIEKYYNSILQKLGITIIGGLKNAHQLEKPTIAEIMTAVNARLISGDFIKVKNKFVDGFLIGAMGSAAALSFMRKGMNQCIITGGDRSDIALAALETSTSLIIFTGNIEPTVQVINKAEEKGIPLVLAPADTF
ncbi:MAG: AAA family ATPase, partial [Promethearchaeota archaeon]